MKLALIILFGVALIRAEVADNEVVLKDFAARNVHYIGNIYKELVKVHTENFILCPLSVQTLFALVNGGARGNTSQQITDSLHLPEGDEMIKETYRRLAESLDVHDKYIISNANKIYVASDFNISQEYKTTATKVFSSEIQNIDFTKSDQAVTEINKWVEEKTFDKIKDLVNEDVVTADTIALFVNALYFQGKWVKEFEAGFKLPFYVSKRKLIFSDMMRVADTFNYYQSEELKAKFLEVPYEGEDISMTFVLPNDFEGLSVLEARIADVLVAPKYSSEEIEVVIPKFKIETTTHLIPILQALGISDAFTSAADFSGIGENQEPLVVSEVLQKAFIEVDEKGTTAAAATYLTISRSGRDDDFSFTADHPFLFYLRHKVNGVLFIGRYTAPPPTRSI